VSLAPATPTASDTLTCTATAGDDDGDTPTVSFAWTVDGSAVSATSTGGGASTLAGAFSRGDLVRCAATADDGKGGTDTDSADLTIANTPPTLSVSLLPSSAATDTVLTANTVSADDDGDTLTLTYAWTVSGTVVASGASDSLDGATAFDRGDTVSVTVTADDGSDTTSATSTTLTVANSAPGAPVVSISPADPEEGEDLLCSVDTASTDADGDAISYTVSWAADGVSYAAGSGWIGPFTTSLTDDSVDGADTLEGETWTCTVTPDDGTDTGTAGSDSVDIDMAIVSGDVSLSITGQDFVSIEAGTFDMGCTTAQAATGACSSHESPVQTVTLTHDFWLGQTEVTQDLFETTMGYNPSWFPSTAVSSCTAQCPVETINWHEAAAMANALSAAEALTECYTCSGTRTSVSCAEAMDPYSCDGYRLPTEAEWEYAARAGTDLLYAGSDAINDVAWWNRTYGSYWTTRAVAGKLPNDWNLYDMSGNVMEWTHDARITYSSAGVVDPNGGTSGCKVLRGGSAGHQTTPYLRVSHRDNCGNTVRYTGGGMRLARTIGG
jgi:formylglycine-generating enzyme required for sulfatase activity